MWGTRFEGKSCNIAHPRPHTTIPIAQLTYSVPLPPLTLTLCTLSPLNTIGIGVDILVEELAAFRVVPRSITDIVNNVRHAAACALETVNELLVFEKIAAGMKTIEPSKQAILDYIREAMKPHLLPARAKSITFDLVLDDSVNEDVWVSIDPVKCKTVFRNLFRYVSCHGRSSVVEVWRNEHYCLSEALI